MDENMEDKEPEKLTIEEQKIIHILLKHLMALKNELAYQNNKNALNSSDNDMQETKVGTKYLSDGSKKIDIGTNDSVLGIKEKDIGTKDSVLGIKEKNIGTNDSVLGIKEKNIGTNDSILGITQKDIGTNNVMDGIKEKVIGTNNVTGSLSEIKIGTKSVMEAFPILKADGNGGALLYSVFEKELIKALEDYIKNGDGQNSLYKFYTDFEEAVEEQNSDATKIKDAESNVRLEDTHVLPVEIPVDATSINKFSGLVRRYLPHKAGKGVNKTIGKELLLLHNAGKANGATLRGFSGLSEAGFKKHLPNLKRYGFIKKQPPSNYVLTDQTNHILLKLFGVAKAD